MNIKMMKLSDIKPYEKNPRKNDEAVKYVAESISRFGFKQPIVIDKDNIIVAGHTRYKASKNLNLKEVPCIVADDLTDEQIKAYRLADNKVAEKAEWDFELLGEELEDLFDFDMAALGFEEVVEEEPAEVEEDDFDVTPPKEAKTKPGDIYQLGRHRLMCGDSTSIDDVEKLMGEVKVDLLITDPPYNVAVVGGNHSLSAEERKKQGALTIKNDSMENDEFRQFLRDAFFCADSVMKEGAVFYIWHADSEGYNFRGACFDIGWEVRQCLIWNKNSMVMGRQDYHWKHEPCLYGWKAGAGHLWASDRKQTTILDFDRPTRNAEHPTMKPVKLFDYQIQNNTKKEDVVLDLFGGSGTTCIACEQNGRTSYTMELDPKYCDVIINRWETLTGEKAVLL